MCACAHLSTRMMCVVAQCVSAPGAAQFTMAPTKSATAAAYRREIATYLRAIQIATGWKQVKMGEMAGGLSHTTIARAMKTTTTIGYPALLALEEAAGLPIPDSLVGAARAAQQPTTSSPTAKQLAAVRSELLDLPEGQRRALLAELQRSLQKTGTNN